MLPLLTTAVPVSVSAVVTRAYNISNVVTNTQPLKDSWRSNRTN